MYNILAPSTERRSLGNWFRERRFNHFRQALHRIKNEKGADTPVQILDVGGLESYWVNMGLANNKSFHITLLNLKQVPTHHPNITSVKGDATNLSGYQDAQFDIVFSNSVIEHLYSYANQIKMSEEVKRVGRYYYIQTPNKHFFIEPHFLLPFFQYLPPVWKYNILVKTKLSRGKRWNEASARNYIKQIRLISMNEMRTLFPNSSLYKEMFLGMTKSFTAHNLN